MLKVLIWLALAAAMIIPVAVAIGSPLLGYRSISYILSGVAAASALSLLLMLPLLGAGFLPGLSRLNTRRIHRLVGLGLIGLIALHIGGLYLTSAPDTIDALLLVSPTPFSIYGVIAMWGLIFTGLIVAARKYTKLSPVQWKWVHNSIAIIVVGASIAHAMLIEGTMGYWSKMAQCAFVGVATVGSVLHVRFFARKT